MSQLFLVKLFIFLLSLFTLFNLNTPKVLAQQDTGWVIDSFHADIIISPDTSVKVTETISVDFNTLEKHGIFRTIPVKYSTALGNNLNIRLKLLSVTDSQGKGYPYSLSYQGKDIAIKIGDPDRTISGQNTYVIRYRVEQVITQPQGFAELYWNVTGSDWPVPISSASATVTGPPGSIQETICFTGYFGSGLTNCTHSHNQTLAEFSSSTLSPGEGLTIATALRPETLRFPNFRQRLIYFLSDNWIYFTPLVVLGLMLYLYWTRGRDKQYINLFHETEGIRTVPLFQKLSSLSVYSPPKDLSPGEVGVLVDEKVHPRDITAVAIDLARRGFFTIKEIPAKGLFAKPDFELKFADKAETGLEKFELETLNMLFDSPRKDLVKLSKPPSSAYKHLDAAQTALYKHLTDQGFFAGNPKTVRSIYISVSVVVLILGFALGAVLFDKGFFTPISVSFALSAFIILVFSFFMPARTPKGRKALKEVVGLREWIRLGAWREQIHEKHNFFEEVLPYTIAFGLTYKFIAAFKSADIKDLSWYYSSQPLNVVYFASSMDSFGTSLNSGVASTRPKSASSGGSGFSGGGSGGGFGGGGGGSW